MFESDTKLYPPSHFLNSEYTKNIVQDIKDILLVFFDSGIDYRVIVADNGIRITIGESGSSSNTFYLDDDKKDALIQIISLTKDKWVYNASYGFLRYPNDTIHKGLYIYDDSRGIRSSGKNIDRDAELMPMKYIQIILNRI